MGQNSISREKYLRIAALDLELQFSMPTKTNVRPTFHCKQKQIKPVFRLMCQLNTEDKSKASPICANKERRKRTPSTHNQCSTERIRTRENATCQKDANSWDIGQRSRSMLLIFTLHCPNKGRLSERKPNGGRPN